MPRARSKKRVAPTRVSSPAPAATPPQSPPEAVHPVREYPGDRHGRLGLEHLLLYIDANRGTLPETVITIGKDGELKSSSPSVWQLTCDRVLLTRSISARRERRRQWRDEYRKRPAVVQRMKALKETRKETEAAIRRYKADHLMPNQLEQIFAAGLNREHVPPEDQYPDQVDDSFGGQTGPF